MNASRRQICLYVSVALGTLFVSYAAASAEASRTIPATYNVVHFGAKADGQTKDTLAVQRAIVTCSEKGGGTVYFP
ncbi:MAG: glycosyl hydrolase family 28-related protein, partial [Sedimentisphaerales bacterium]